MHTAYNVLFALTVFAIAASEGSLTEVQLEALKGKELLNEDAILKAVDWETERQEQDPYPTGTSNYSVLINQTVDCYVLFFDKFQKDSYKLLSLNTAQANSLGFNGNSDGNICNAGTSLTGPIPSCENLTPEEEEDCFRIKCNRTEIRKTHTSQCGACSKLENVFVYLTEDDLTSAARSCGLQNIFGDDLLQCISDLGFTEPCAQIWRWNVDNTARKGSDGGCLEVCAYYTLLGVDPIEPNVNPLWGSPCDPEVCFTSINEEQTCPDEIFQEGSEFRLNACLQCDECRSGPLFQRIAGRTRRSSGIESTIPRPEESICMDCIHDYGLPFGAPTTSPPTNEEVIPPDPSLIVALVLIVIAVLGLFIIF